jgi:putative RecB family exonuclease
VVQWTMLPTHLSYSTYNTWTRCPKSFQLGKIVEAPAKPAVYFAGGSAVHSATEDHDREDRVMKPWEQYFYPEVSAGMEDHAGTYWDTGTWLAGGPKDKPESPQDWMTIGPLCIENWIKFLDDFTVEKIELDVTTELPGCPVPIKGYVDRVGVHKKHGPMIIDIKTGKNKPKDSTQLLIYKTLMLEKFGEAPTKGAYFMAREGRIIGKPVEMPMDDRVGIGKMFGDVYRQMQEFEKLDLYPAVKEFNCLWCTQQDNCLAYAGDTKQAKKYDPYYAQGKVPY